MNGNGVSGLAESLGNSGFSSRMSDFSKGLSPWSREAIGSMDAIGRGVPSSMTARSQNAKTLGSKPATAGDLTPSLGGSIEHFRIGDRIVMGEMVFDATRDCDGITLNLPFDLLTEISPAKFAMCIQQWREWMIESVIREMPKSVASTTATSCFRGVLPKKRAE